MLHSTVNVTSDTIVDEIAFIQGKLIASNLKAFDQNLYMYFDHLLTQIQNGQTNWLKEIDSELLMISLAELNRILDQIETIKPHQWKESELIHFYARLNLIYERLFSRELNDAVVFDIFFEMIRKIPGVKSIPKLMSSIDEIINNPELDNGKRFQKIKQAIIEIIETTSAGSSSAQEKINDLKSVLKQISYYSLKFSADAVYFKKLKPTLKEFDLTNEMIDRLKESEQDPRFRPIIQKINIKYKNKKYNKSDFNEPKVIPAFVQSAIDMHYQTKTSIPTVTNLANGYAVCGAGYPSKAKSQEESLARCSNIKLGMPFIYANDYWDGENILYIGLDKMGGSYRTENCTLFGYIKNNKMVPFTDKFKTFHQVVVAAPDFRFEHICDYYDSKPQEYIAYMAKAAHAQAQHAIAAESDTLICGALGCGVFMNEPALVALIHMAVFQHVNYSKLAIQFAISGRKVSGVTTLADVFEYVFKNYERIRELNIARHIINLCQGKSGLPEYNDMPLTQLENELRSELSNLNCELIAPKTGRKSKPAPQIKKILPKPAITNSDDDFTLTPSSTSSAPPVPDQTNININNINFRKEGLRLRESEIYFAACGMFMQHHFNCLGVVKGNPNEIARVYRKTDDGMLYILYRPGKDNNDPFTGKGNFTLSLDSIMAEANKVIEAIYGETALKNAKKIFVVGESIDDWSRGYHSIEAIERDITRKEAPKEFKITEEIRQKHFNYYQLGWENVPPALIPPAPTRIPVSGKISKYSNAEDCFITVKSLEKSHRRKVRDNNLEIVASEQNGRITLKVLTSKEIGIFEKLGLKQIRVEGEHAYYQLSIDRNHAKIQDPNIKERLFELRINVDEKIKSIDVSHLFTAEEVKKFRERAENKPKEGNNEIQPKVPLNDDPVLQAIRGVNHYLKARAKKTSGFFAMLTGSYTGRAYHLRRLSWMKILEGINSHIENKETERKALLSVIKKEADKFKPGAFTIFPSNYYTSLMNLHKKISETKDYDFTTIAEKVDSFCQIYEGMEPCKYTMKKYIDNRSLFFTSKKEEKYESRLNLEYQLYKAQYEMLSETDQKDFLEPGAEIMSEYHMIRRYNG